MGVIDISAMGSMTPDENVRRSSFPHGSSYQACVDAARAFLDDLEHDLRVKVGDEAYETK